LIETIVLIALFAGILVRTIIPALRKMAETPDFQWNHQYTATMIISLIISFISALTLYQSFHVPESTEIQVAIAAFFAGLGLNSGVDELAKVVAIAYSKKT